MTTSRTATSKDFKIGTVLTTKEGFTFSINEHYLGGMWNTRQGKIVKESEAKFYKVAS